MSQQPATEQSNAPTKAEPAAGAAASPSADAQKKHVLVIDHNPVMGRILSKMLDKAGLRFSTAISGEEAVGFCENTAYDLVLVEARMPGLNGQETAQEIRALGGTNADIPIIALGTRFDDARISKNRAHGITDELKKPVIEFNLMQTLANHLGVGLEAVELRPPEDDEIYAVLDEDEMTLLNWDTLKEYSAVLKGEYKNLMRDFLKVSPDLIGDIGEAVVDGNAKQIEFLAHKLKSTSLIFGAEGLSNVAAQLELLGREDELEHASQYYKELHMSFERVRPVLRKKLVLMHSPI